MESFLNPLEVDDDERNLTEEQMEAMELTMLGDAEFDSFMEALQMHQLARLYEAV